MSGDWTIVENGRVSALFKAMMSVATALLVMGISAVFIVTWRLNDAVSDLKTSISVMNNNYMHSQNEHLSFRATHQDLQNAITNLGGRVSDLERQRDRTRNDR